MEAMTDQPTSEVKLLMSLVLAACKWCDAEAAWEGNPSRFLQDHKASAEAARVAREALKDAVRQYRQAKRAKERPDAK